MLKKKKKKQQKNKPIRKVSLKNKISLLIFLLLFFFIIIFPELRISKFPMRHSDQPSPEKYVRSKMEILSTTLPEPIIIKNGPRDSKNIAITFDADMTYAMLDMLHSGTVKSWYNKPVKEYLDKESVRFTVFFTGLWVKTYPKEAREIAHDPLVEIGNHSYSHPAFSANCFGLPMIEQKFAENEVESAQKIIIEKTGIIPEIFRFPGGCYEDIDVKTITRLGLKIIHWDVVGEDSFNNNIDSITENIKQGTQNGSIIVLHLNQGPFAPKTYEALLQAIPYLKAKGFRFVKVSELISDNKIESSFNQDFLIK
jgi:peptidoglycan-N-acetylglucosamine deacetylase